MPLIIVESVSSRMIEEQGGDLRDEGASGAGYWLIQEIDKNWRLLARFASHDDALHFSYTQGIEFIREDH